MPQIAGGTASYAGLLLFFRKDWHKILSFHIYCIILE